MQERVGEVGGWPAGLKGKPERRGGLSKAVAVAAHLSAPTRPEGCPTVAECATDWLSTCRAKWHARNGEFCRVPAH
jgi:hypothetical protein